VLGCTNNRSLTCSNQTEHISQQLDTLNRPHTCRSDAGNKHDEEPGLLGCDAVLLGVLFPTCLHFQGHCISHHYITEDLHLQQHHSKNHISCHKCCHQVMNTATYQKFLAIFRFTTCNNIAFLLPVPHCGPTQNTTAINTMCTYYCGVYECYSNPNFNFLLLSILLFLNQCVIPSLKKAYR